MEGREKIRQLLREGKVNSDQAVMLLHALKESESRREKVFKQVLSQKKKREKNKWGFLGMWLLVVFATVMLLLALGINQGIGQDAGKALVYFNQASSEIEGGRYEEAIDLIKKGTRKASRFPLGYTLLGSTYRLLQERTGDASLIKEETKAFEKAHHLKDNYTRRSQMNTIAIFFACIFVLLTAGVLTLIFTFLYNRLVNNEESVNEAWAQLKTFYDRKADLIPALLGVIKNYTTHEKDTLQHVAQARADASKVVDGVNLDALKEAQLQKVSASQKTLEGMLGKLYAVAEHHPDLKANANYLTIQQQLEEAEDEIVRARSQFNRRVRAYNSAVRGFPLNVVAASFKFAAKGYLGEKKA
ncbi:LemA family protein [Candidatus Omnitrophota bacterium]